MAYDEDLAGRIRWLVRGEAQVTEKRMFGGLAFLMNGNMSVSASGRGGLLLRVDPALTDELVTDPVAERFVMRGRPMDGWLHIDIDAGVPEKDLRRWVDLGVTYAKTLPPK